MYRLLQARVTGRRSSPPPTCSTLTRTVLRPLCAGLKAALSKEKVPWFQTHGSQGKQRLPAQARPRGGPQHRSPLPRLPLGKSLGLADSPALPLREGTECAPYEDCFVSPQTQSCQQHPPSPVPCFFYKMPTSMFSQFPLLGQAPERGRTGRGGEFPNYLCLHSPAQEIAIFVGQLLWEALCQGPHPVVRAQVSLPAPTPAWEWCQILGVQRDSGTLSSHSAGGARAGGWVIGGPCCPLLCSQTRHLVT